MKKSEKKRLEKQLKLQKQAEADRYRANRMKVENIAMRNQVKAYADGIEQLNRALDAILAEVAVNYGKQIENGVWEMSIPVPDTDRAAKCYKVGTRLSEDAERFVTTVVWIGKEESREASDQGDASGAE